MNALIVILAVIVGLIYEPVVTLLLLIVVAVLARPIARAANNTLSGR